MSTEALPTKLYVALLKAQTAMGKLHKDAQNAHMKNRYATLAAILDTVRGPLSDSGLILYQSATTVDADPGVDVIVTTALIHAETGQQIAERISIPLSKVTAQEIGSAITYGRRYLAMAMCGLAPGDDDDDDGNAASRNPVQRKPAQRNQTRTPVTGPEPGDLWDDAPPIDQDGPVEAPAKLGAITKTQMAELHSLGSTFYSDGWDAKRHEMVKVATREKYTSSTDLTQAQAAVLIQGIYDRLLTKISDECAQHAIDLAAILPAHNVKSLDDASPVALTHIYRDVMDKAVETVPA